MVLTLDGSVLPSRTVQGLHSGQRPATPAPGEWRMR
jgi:hypothetical protein